MDDRMLRGLAMLPDSVWIYSQIQWCSVGLEWVTAMLLFSAISAGSRLVIV